MLKIWAKLPLVLTGLDTAVNNIRDKKTWVLALPPRPRPVLNGRSCMQTAVAVLYCELHGVSRPRRPERQQVSLLPRASALRSPRPPELGAACAPHRALPPAVKPAPFSVKKKKDALTAEQPSTRSAKRKIPSINEALLNSYARQISRCRISFGWLATVFIIFIFKTYFFFFFFKSCKVCVKRSGEGWDDSCQSLLVSLLFKDPSE